MGGRQGNRIAHMQSVNDYLIANPEGVTVSDIGKALSISKGTVHTAIHDLRLKYGEDDVMNIKCSPNGRRAEWLYSFVANWESIQPYSFRRIIDLFSRVQTQGAISASIDRAIATGAISARKARIAKKYFTRMQEDLRDLSEDIA